MAHTDRETLERVPSFTQQLRDAEIARAEEAAAVRCDSCGEKVDQDLEPGRYRHADCPPPPIPAAAMDALARMHSRRADQEHREYIEGALRDRDDEAARP